MRKRKNDVKSDQPQITFEQVFSVAVKVVVAAAIAVFFVRNVIPFQKEAIVLDSVSAPETSVTSSVHSSLDITSGTSSTENSLSSGEQSSAPEFENSESSEIVSSAAGVVPNIAEEPTSSKININTASAEQLKMLDGIGDVKAKAIVEYREKNGGFKSVDELDNVKGIGKATLDKLRDQITV